MNILKESSEETLKEIFVEPKVELNFEPNVEPNFEPKEIFVVCKENDNYKISNFGNLIRVYKNGKIKKTKGFIWNGYLCADLSKNGNVK